VLGWDEDVEVCERTFDRTVGVAGDAGAFADGEGDAVVLEGFQRGNRLGDDLKTESRGSEAGRPEGCLCCCGDFNAFL
jgi:hypothetical protein